MESESSSGKHTWLPEEDAVLVELLVDMKLTNKYILENGFKPGFLQYLEVKMDEKLPGCGLKATPHIQSRLKTLKSHWQVVYDMVNGTNTSGFGWDPVKQSVYAEKSVWDEYVKIHRKAAPFRTKPFSHYESLCIVWAKDKATGKDAQAAEDAVQEDQHVPQKDETETGAGPSLQAEYDTTEYDGVNSNFPTTPRSDATSMSKRRRCLAKEKDEPPLTVVLKEIFQQATHELCIEVRKLAHENNMDEIVRTLFEDISKVPGLTYNEILEAHNKISSNNRMLVAFTTIPDHVKANWISRIIK